MDCIAAAAAGHGRHGEESDPCLVSQTRYSDTMFPKPKRLEDPDLLKAVRIKRCLVCGVTPCDPAHIRSRGSGGPDTHWNVIPLCRRHHSEQHTTGWWLLAQRYRQLHIELIGLGWEFNEWKAIQRINPMEDEPEA